jgi:hypothetical protein
MHAIELPLRFWGASKYVHAQHLVCMIVCDFHANTIIVIDPEGVCMLLYRGLMCRPEIDFYDQNIFLPIKSKAFVHDDMLNVSRQWQRICDQQ